MFVIIKTDFGTDITVNTFPTKGGVLKYLLSEFEFERYDDPDTHELWEDIDVNNVDYLVLDMEDPEELHYNLMTFENFFEFLEAFDPDNHYREGAKESVIIRFDKF